MSHIPRYFTVSICCAALSFGGSSKGKRTVENTVTVMWRAPDDIASRNLYYGPGGKDEQPHGTVTFESEDMNGTNPKFVVRDADGVKWTVKLGNEARAETVATRLVWAAGYFANEDYFVADLRVEGMSSRLRRGRNLVTLEGARNVRLKRHDPDEKDIGAWSWRDNPFRSTRELNGLRVLMALINNWDLKDENNAIYRDKKSGEQVYMISDLGASFGAAAHIVPQHRSKGDLEEYQRSKFIRKENSRTIDFADPGRPSILYLPAFRSYVRRVRMEWIGRNIPRADAKWIGEILGRLSAEQLRDVFRAGGYSPAEVEAFTKILENRIAQLRDL